MKSLSLSTIVVTSNNPYRLFLTLSSILSQDLTNIDHTVVIVDGSHFPQSIDFHELNIRYIFEENPCGIYHAMNLGIQYSETEFLHFLNPGDTFYSVDSLQEVRASLENISVSTLNNINGFFCHSRIVYDFPFPSSWYSPPIHINNIKRWLFHYTPNHQSFFARTSWAESNPFVLNSPECADRSWMSKALQDSSSLLCLPIILVNYPLDGVSSKLPNYCQLRSRLNEPSRTYLQKLSEFFKFMLRPLSAFYPLLMHFRVLLISMLIKCF